MSAQHGQGPHGEDRTDSSLQGLGKLAAAVREHKPPVLVTGGAGYIGCHTAKALAKAGFQPVVLDNLSAGHREFVRWGPLVVGDVGDQALVVDTLKRHRIQAVIHFAGSALVGESMKNPGLYFRNNTTATMNLLESVVQAGVRFFVFASSCATYGIPESIPITENHPQRPSNPYGESKLAIERQIRWYCEIFGLRSVILRYFNAAGADAGGEIGELREQETHVLPLALQSAFGLRGPFEILGEDYPTPDGTAIRDMVHVTDLAAAHLKALQYLLEGGQSVALNLGTGKGTSVRQILDAIEQVAGSKVPAISSPRRPGDPPRLIADPTLAWKVLGWRTEFDLAAIVGSAARWTKGAEARRTRASVSVTDQSPARARVAVIGAGPAGLTAAYELARNGAEVDVYEAGPRVGGLSQTFALWDQLVDLGPHRFFSTDARINRLWLDVVGRDYRMVDRLTRIYYNGKFFYYPLKAFDALKKLGALEAVHCGLSYLRQKASPRPGEGTFEDWVVRAFGRRLFEIFFKTYSEKLWGISCRDLDADFAAQRIKKLSLYEAVKNAVIGSGGNKHKTLVDRFAYPSEGTGMVYARMASEIRARGQNVLLQTPVERVVTRQGRVEGLELKGGGFVPYSHVISTMPLTVMVKRLPDVPAPVVAAADRLRFRNTIIVYLHVEGSGLFPDNWLYVHSTDLLMGRVTNFRNWSPTITQGQPNTILALEYWCFPEDSVWQWDDRELVDMASREMRLTGLLGDAKVLNGAVRRIPRCYPVYSRGYKDELKPIVDHLQTIDGLQVIGRYGSFKYNNQDHSILMGLLAAGNILRGESNKLWQVNTDYEDYQEAATITEEGLVVESAG